MAVGSRWLTAALVMALACGPGEGDAPAPGAADSARAAAEASTEPAGPGPWVGEIRAGIRDLPSLVTTDPVAARRQAVELYATRQEALERRWGVRGSDAPQPDLARTVMEAETSFHELLALLNSAAAPDSAQVAAGVAALDERLAAVLAAAGEAP